MALLHLTADWTRSRGRRLLAVTIDHGLNPDSSAWGEACRRACQALGVGWSERRWAGPKPSTGLTAAAREARHRLLAEAAREAGARVILMAHTADDIAESQWMRSRSVEAGGSTLGGLRDWSPSPAWPEGRDLMLLRPLLGERRVTLRGFLSGLGSSWIEDPANADPRFGRSRARAALAGASRLEADPDTRPVQPRYQDGRAVEGLVALPLGTGFAASRGLAPAVLAAAVVSAGGGTRPPRGDRLSALSARIAGGEDFTASLAGARILAEAGAVLIGREAGDFRRRPAPDLALPPGRPAVWDGRYAIIAREAGWKAVPALGRLASLSAADRAVVGAVPAWARGALPVLIREDRPAPVLAWRMAEVRALAPRRLDLALAALGLGETTQETALFRPVHGETPSTDLF